jgi:hypothetical protein
MPLEDLIAGINAAGWTMHSLSQYRSMGRLAWSATVRRDGSGRQPISRGQGADMYQAVAIAYGGIGAADLEPETTVHVAPTEPPMTLANLLPIPPLITPTIIRRR